MNGKNAVIRNVRECLQELGLPVQPPFLGDPNYAVVTGLTSNGVPMVLHLVHDPRKNILVFLIYFSAKLKGQNEKIFEAMDELNFQSLLGHFAVCDQTNKVTFRFAYFLSEGGFNKNKFKTYFEEIVFAACENYPQLQKLISEGGANS
jgi:hypothetical protein